MKVGAVILAAGEARRAGGAKVAWPLGGSPSVLRVARAALGAAKVAETLAVTGGPWAGAVREVLAGLPLKLVDNPDYAAGQASSLCCGLKALGADITAAMFLLADQPFITSQIIDDMVKFMEESEAPLVAPARDGRRLNPVLFDLDRFGPDLRCLSGDRGGRDIIAAAGPLLALWPADEHDPKCFADFDTLEDYERLGGNDEP